MEKRILLIIDDEHAEMFIAILKTADIDAIGFKDGISGLEWLKTHNAELILCDLALPKMSGMRVGEKIREMGIRTKLVFITGQTLERIDYEWAAELDATVFQKPFDAKEFIEFVKKII